MSSSFSSTSGAVNALKSANRSVKRAASPLEGNENSPKKGKWTHDFPSDLEVRPELTEAENESQRGRADRLQRELDAADRILSSYRAGETSLKRVIEEKDKRMASHRKTHMCSKKPIEHVATFAALTRKQRAFLLKQKGRPGHWKELGKEVHMRERVMALMVENKRLESQCEKAVQKAARVEKELDLTKIEFESL